jgi:hypothetical protein
VQAITECHAIGIEYGYYSGKGASCVNSKLDPAVREKVDTFSRLACTQARAINSFDPEEACQQASIEAENAAWHALAAQPADGPPPVLSIDNLMPGFGVRYGTPDLPGSSKANH